MKHVNLASERIGEESISTNGQKMKIIAYRSTNDIDVQFEDGNIVKNKSYAHFKEGKISQMSLNKEKRLGETKIMKCGKKATIIKYNNAHDLTIKFEDGVIVKHKYYTDFANGLIKHPNISTSEYAITKSGETIVKKYRKLCIGQTNTAKNGQTITITNYDGYDDVEVTFDDGTVVTGQRYEKFQKGEIVNPNNRIFTSTSINEYVMMFYLSKLGFKKAPQGSLEKYGLGRMELDAFYEDKKIAVEYDGNVHSFRKNTDKRKDNACKKAGITLIRIRENLPKVSDYSTTFHLSTCKAFSEEYEKILQGVCNKLAEYGFNSIGIDFKKDKDTIMNEFEKIYIVSHLGEEFTSTDGFHCKIVRYINSNEVYVEFDDKTQKRASYHNLKNGFKKNSKDVLSNLRIGEEKIMKCGMKAKIINYRNANDIDIQFEDKTIVINKRYDHFKEGGIGHPNYKNKKYISD